MTSWQFQKFGIAALAALCIFLCPSARAQNPDTSEPPKQVELNADNVKRFVATFEQIRQWQKANNTTSKTTDENDDADEEGGSDDASAMALVQTAKNSVEVKAILKKNNFEDMDKFAQVAQSVMLAYGYADPESGLADLEGNIKKSIDQVKSDKELSDDEKAEAIKNLESEALSVQKLKPLPGNIEVVKPYVAEIKKVVESE
jgi:hypothetical protein